MGTDNWGVMPTTKQKVISWVVSEALQFTACLIIAVMLHYTIMGFIPVMAIAKWDYLLVKIAFGVKYAFAPTHMRPWEFIWIIWRDA